MQAQIQKRVLVTGADAGLGLSLVKRFLQGGFAVLAGVHRLAVNWSSLTEEQGDSLRLIPLDVANMDSVCEAAQQVASQIDALDILINNAGIHLKDSRGPLELLDLGDDQLQLTMNVNAFGPLRMVQQFLPLLEKGRQKLILNISSEAGSIADCGRENQFAYCMSKAALNMQTKILQNYLKPRGFKVLAIHPGWMRTNMGGQEASISPDESADGIFQLADRAWQAEDPIYMDYLGNPLPW